MRVRCGTSGWNYGQWKGPFYPEELAAKQMLSFYGSKLDTVEVNNTFYRIPRSSVVEGWASSVPDGFTFVLKASRRITHFGRLGERTAESVDYMWRAASKLADRVGPILFQLPPNLKLDAARLRGFVERLPADCRAVFEFRHESWIDSEVHNVLHDAGHAICVADAGEDAPSDIIATCDWGYLRLRRPSYSEAELDVWERKIRQQPWRECFVFFKHEEAGIAPDLARTFAQRFGQTS